MARLREQAKCGERLQVKLARYREPGACLIRSQVKLHCRSIDAVDFLVIKAPSRQCDLGRNYHIALYFGRRCFKRRSRKHSFPRRGRGWAGGKHLLILRRIRKRLNGYRRRICSFDGGLLT